MVCCGLLTVVGYIAAIVIVFKIYLKLTTGWCRSQTSLLSKTAIITGANTGVGYETALDFAKRGGRVILACRNKAKGEEAVEKIIKETRNPNVVLKIVDMCSFKSIRAFAKDINETEKQLDILVNNAGAAFSEPRYTEDGHLEILQINYLGPFLLTNLLMGLLKKTENSRIINVSSMGAKHAKLDIDNLSADPGKNAIYVNTKVCNILFTKELAKRLSGTSVTTYSLHPGLVQTDIFRNMSFFLTILYNYMFKFFSKTCEEGAQTQIYTAVAQGIEHYNGEHFHDCKRVETYKTASDPTHPRKLWDKTVELIKMTKDEIII